MAIQSEAELASTAPAWDRTASMLFHWLIVVHRWTGVALCAVFAIWCISGAILLFAPYPDIPYSELLSHSPAIDLQKLSVAPSEAIASAGGGSAIYLIDVAGEPVYMISGARGARGSVVAISGVTGNPLKQLSAQTAKSVAERFEHDSALRVDPPIDYDPWVVRSRVNGWRPFYKITFPDPQNTFVYVSARTGEIVERAQFWQRVLGWLGEITHSFYFVPLAKYKLWDPGVWSLGLVSIAIILSGIWLGTYRSIKQARKIKPGISPYRGWMRQHHIFGLSASFLLLAYMVSGWLAMDHGRLFSQTILSGKQVIAYQGGTLADVLRPVTVEQVRALGHATRISLTGVAGRAVVTTLSGAPPRTEIVDRSGEQRQAAIPTQWFGAAAAAAWSGSQVKSISRAANDDVHLMSETFVTYQAGQIVGHPLEIRLNGQNPIRVYVDDTTGKIITARDRSHLAYDWVFFTLHTYNFPWLSSRPILRIGISLFALVIILTFVVTAGIIGLRRVRMVTAR